jgi:colicin import membrane protein
MKIYFIGPIAALAVFAAYTWHFDKAYDANEAAKAAQVREAHDAKIKGEAEARKKAIEEAVLAQKALKKERADKEAEEARKKEARVTAIEKRDQSFKEQEKSGHQAERLKRDLRNEEEAVAKLDASIKATIAEKEFQGQFIIKAKENVVGLADLLAKVNAADQAHAAVVTTAPTTKS